MARKTLPDMITVPVPKKVKLIPFLRKEIRRIMKSMNTVKSDKDDMIKALKLLKEPITNKKATVGKVFNLLDGLSTSLKDEIVVELWDVLQYVYCC